MPIYTDQTGRQITLEQIPQRIISLVPSQTELLYDLGLDTAVIGITKFCIHPDEWFRSKTRIGGTKQLKTDLIHQLKPDLIIANKEENVKEQIEELAKHYPVWISDVTNLDNACDMIVQVGSMTGKAAQAMQIVNDVRAGFENVKDKIQHVKYKTAYLIWNDPYMTVGGDTFISNMLDIAGFENIYANQTRYPIVSIEQLRAASCGKTQNLELVFLSSEPFPFKQKHIDELKSAGITADIVLVDGEMFSWYGSRMRLAADYFLQLHNTIFKNEF